MNFEESLQYKDFVKLYGAAISFAMTAHAGQVRKYTGLPYVTHPIEVGFGLYEDGAASREIIAGILHDVIEDTDYTFEDIVDGFGKDVAALVLELTDHYTKELYPQLNRAHRKDLEAQRLGGASYSAKKVKLADIANNTSTIVKQDPAFAVTYLAEASNLIRLLLKRETFKANR